MVDEIRVTVQRATGLVGNDGFGSNKTSDPFVELTLLRGNEEVIKSTPFKTRDVQKTVNPLWNEHFVIGRDVDLRMAHYLCCTVYDKNFLKNVPLGRVLVPMDDARSCILSGTRVERTYPVTKFGSMKVATGELYLAFEPANGPPAPPPGQQNDPNAGDASIAVAAPTGPPNVLHVTVESATGLPAMDRGGTSDPLVIISCGKTKLNTTTKNKTLSCMWNEHFKLPVDDPSQFVLFVVEDFDATFNDFMGQVKVPLETLQDEAKQTLTLELLDKKFRKKGDLGTLTVTLHWTYTENISSVVDSNKKKQVGLFSKITNTITGVPDAGDLDEDGIDADALENTTTKSPEELKKEQEEKEKAREEERKALEDINIKSGDYSVQVHIIEARDLVAKDATGTSDPVVYVDVMEQSQNTATKSKTLSAVWDEVLIFTFRDLDKEAVEMGAIKICVMDANTLQRAELIGESQFDVSFIYAKLNHQICNTWIGLTAVGADSIQGYLRISITIVGPGDKFVPPPPIDPKDSGLGNVMMPLSVKQEVNFLVVSVHVGEDLPPMDSVAVLGQKLKQGIDAYVECSLGGGKSIRTRVKTKNGERRQLSPAFNDELWMVLREPSMANKVSLVVKDWDRVGSDEVVAHSYQSLRLIKKMCSASSTGIYGPLWLNLYGAPLNFTGSSIIPGENSAKNEMNTFPDLATFYRGRILVTFRINPNERHLDEINQRVKATPLPRQLYPEVSSYTVRAFLGTGSDIPQMTSLSGVGTRNSKMQIIVTCGLNELAFERKDNNKGLVVWNQLKEEKWLLPKDASQIPDIFVYLCKGKVEGKLQGRKQVSYRRFSAKALLDEEMGKEPTWLSLKEDPSVDALGDSTFPGSIFLNLGFGLDETAARTAPKWNALAADVERLREGHRYQVRVNVFQGRQLPAMDDNGLSDPYIDVRFFGEKRKIKEKKKTVNPLWYETVTYDVELPPENMLHFSPQVILRVMDWDVGIGNSADDYIGSSFLPITSANLRKPNDPRPDPEPQWYSLVQQEEGDTDGHILASVVVVRLDYPDQVLPPPPSIVPKMRTAYLEVIVLGLRDMRPYQFLPIQLPYIDFNLGGAEHANQEMKTEKSKRPSGANPNFLQRIVREVELPENSLFAPMLNVFVKDTRLGGWYKPLVGNCSINMSTKLPWAKGYVPPQSLDLDSIPDQAEDEDDDDQNDESTPLMDTKSPVKKDIGAGVFGALELMNIQVDMNNPSLLTDEGILRSTQLSTQMSADEDSMDEDGAGEYEAKRKKYMKNRQDLSEELEANVLKTKPFETYKLMTGQKKKKKSLLSLLKIGSKKSKAASAESGGGTFHVAGIFKGLIRVMLKENEPPLVNLEKLLNPQPYTVRIYILNGEGFQPMDPGFDGRPGKSDPYMVLRLGKTKINDRKNYIDDVVDPDFYKMFEIPCNFPGASTLHLDAYDYDLIGGDDLIGSTTVDLEDRFFDKNWQALGEEFKTSERWGPKPVEQRTLHVPTSRAPMGQLKLWIDILTPKDAAAYPPVDIALPPPITFELRVVIWKTKEVPNFDELTEMNDLFVRCQLEGSDSQDTDIHWRAKKGKASFNWRMKFPVTLGHKQHNSKFPYFKMQMWDKDIFSSNDCIAEGILDMSPHFKKVCQLKAPYQVFQDKTPKTKVKETSAQQRDNDAILSIKEATGLWDHNPTDSTWIKMERLNRATGVKEPMGAVCISMELVPIEKAKIQSVGFGRSDPNNNPFLPPPSGRLKFSMNPFYVFNQLLGPKICRRFMCCLCCVAVMVAMYFLGPFINILIVMLK
ncbi:unnamed protein product [Aphanomyces euteiches]|uniref:C2 domain-containing protein n=1 Tax=Aphanomyces euteiches TaxID=100861 RepID=A0A6G0WJX2_9STRA|nr:hypothetical protein Ae201684_014385 [Aphanomyces euteiches]KAH9158201.1 hypothetical protein AeRB84_000034 [Aphanomyces euteiches]